MSHLIIYGCLSCYSAFQVSKTDENLHLLSLRMPCPTPSCEGSLELIDKDEVFKTVQLVRAQELFSASMGRGFEHERKCSPKQLAKLLENSEIQDVDLEEAGKDRSIIKSMVVLKYDKNGDGGMLHRVCFAMSTKGATIYKVEENVVL